MKFTLLFGQAHAPAASATAWSSFSSRTGRPIPSACELDSLDPFNDVTRFEELAKRVPELELLQGGGGVVIEFGTGRRCSHAVVRNQDLFLPLRLDPAPRAMIASPRRSPARTRSPRRSCGSRKGKKTKVGFTVGPRRAVDRRLEPARPRDRQLEGPFQQGRL